MKRLCTAIFLALLLAGCGGGGIGGSTPPPSTLAWITASDLPHPKVGQPYSYQLQATGGTGRYTYAVTSGALPQGLKLSSAGLISGTPTGASGSFVISIQVSD